MANRKHRGNFKLGVISRPGDIPGPPQKDSLPGIISGVSVFQGNSGSQTYPGLITKTDPDGGLHAYAPPSKIPATDIGHDFQGQLTQAREDSDRRKREQEDAAILARRTTLYQGRKQSAAKIARDLQLPLERVKNVIHPRKKRV